jgi:hypothetical protein
MNPRLFLTIFLGLAAVVMHGSDGYAQVKTSGNSLWMTDEKKTKEILAKRLKINDKEILNWLTRSWQKRSLIPRWNESNSKSMMWRGEMLRQTGSKPEDFINITALKELDQSGFIDAL